MTELHPITRTAGNGQGSYIRPPSNFGTQDYRQSMTTNSKATLTTRTGFRFEVRSARPEDEPVLAEFFTHVTPDDLRFRSSAA